VTFHKPSQVETYTNGANIVEKNNQYVVHTCVCMYVCMYRVGVCNMIDSLVNPICLYLYIHTQIDKYIHK
jgi:hypothetical protein